MTNDRLFIYLNCFELANIYIGEYKLNNFDLFYSGEIENTLALLLFCRNNELTEMDFCNLYLRFNNIQDKISLNDGEYNWLYTKDIT